jgi:hypothetical protein
LSFATHTTSLLGWVHLLPIAFLKIHSTFLTSLTSCGLHYSLSFILTASYIILSGAAYKNSDPGTYCLVSLFFWNLNFMTSEFLHSTCLKKQYHLYDVKVEWQLQQYLVPIG